MTDNDKMHAASRVSMPVGFVVSLIATFIVGTSWGWGWAIAMWIIPVAETIGFLTHLIVFMILRGLLGVVPTTAD